MANFDITKFYKAGNLYLIPPYIESDEKAVILKAWNQIDISEHVFILSSGTSSGSVYKSYAISKSAIIANARGVNSFLNCTESDSWFSSLPFYHIGGLSIFVRAFEANSKLVENKEKWNAKLFVGQLKNNSITYTSLVPTQLFDIVNSKLVAPRDLKGIFIGGDFLDDAIRDEALELNWPLIQTYGMTETASQIASSFTDSMNGQYLEVLNLHKIIKTAEGFFIKSPSLFTKEIIIDGDNIKVVDCLNNTFKMSDDISLLNDGPKQFLIPKGRLGDEIKIKGRLYNFLDLKNFAKAVFLQFDVYNKIELSLVRDEREGVRLQLWVEEEVRELAQEVLVAVNKKMPSVLAVKTIKYYQKLPRTNLGKLRIS
jgi:O-succinylbenzoic acid--CoA ligase